MRGPSVAELVDHYCGEHYRRLLTGILTGRDLLRRVWCPYCQLEWLEVWPTTGGPNQVTFVDPDGVEHVLKIPIDPVSALGALTDEG